jgi:hypothetical protein
VRGHMDRDGALDVGWLCSVSRTSASGAISFCPVKRPMAILDEGAINRGDLRLG